MMVVWVFLVMRMTTVCYFVSYFRNSAVLCLELNLGKRNEAVEMVEMVEAKPHDFEGRLVIYCSKLLLYKPPNMSFASFE